jgi:hypothetical protein
VFSHVSLHRRGGSRGGCRDAAILLDRQHATVNRYDATALDRYDATALDRYDATALDRYDATAIRIEDGPTTLFVGSAVNECGSNSSEKAPPTYSTPGEVAIKTGK